MRKIRRQAQGAVCARLDWQCCNAEIEQFRCPRLGANQAFDGLWKPTLRLACVLIQGLVEIYFCHFGSPSLAAQTCSHQPGTPPPVTVAPAPAFTLSRGVWAFGTALIAQDAHEEVLPPLGAPSSGARGRSPRRRPPRRRGRGGAWRLDHRRSARGSLEPWRRRHSRRSARGSIGPLRVGALRAPWSRRPPRTARGASGASPSVCRSRRPPPRKATRSSLSRSWSGGQKSCRGRAAWWCRRRPWPIWEFNVVGHTHKTKHSVLWRSVERAAARGALTV